MSKVDEVLGIKLNKPVTKESLKEKYKNTFTFYDSLMRQARTLTCPLLSSISDNIDLLPNKVYNLWNSKSIGNANIWDLRDTAHELVLQEVNAAKEGIKWVKSRNTTLAGMFEVACALLAKYDDKFKNKYHAALHEMDIDVLNNMMEEYNNLEEEDEIQSK